MNDSSKSLSLIRDTFESLQCAGIISPEITFSEDLVLLGNSSKLDSLGFVTFISDLEERVSADAGKDHYLILTDIQDANADQAFLSAGALAAYIEKITG